MRFSQNPRVTVFTHDEREIMSREEIKKRFPKLIRALQWVLIGSEGEAVCTIRCHLQGIEFGCEAVSHAGGTNADAIRRAFQCRRACRERY